jgi:hypothetical protein
MISQTYLGGFRSGREMTRDTLARHGEVVDVGEWQSIRDDKMPQARTIELQNVVIAYPIPPTYRELQWDVKPNMPFAEAQFQDRVSGQPLNPPPSDKLWPWAHHLDDDKKSGKYSHTYPERFWPKKATDKYEGEPATELERIQRYVPTNHGIRFDYGDLQDVVTLLAKSPYTRQAYLPVWFPEDTGAVHGERVPCTLGYHFLLREDKLNITYFIRSVDFFRHFPDDVYMACRLCQWMIDAINSKEGELFDWPFTVPGMLTMHICSLHVFEAERKRLEKGST